MCGELFDPAQLCLTEPLDGRSVEQEIILPGGIIGRRRRLAGMGGSLSELTRRGGEPLGRSRQDYTLCERGCTCGNTHSEGSLGKRLSLGKAPPRPTLRLTTIVPNVSA